jgi:hypothetical protein
VWLLKSGANIDAKSWNGDTPLHSAILTRHLATVELLLAAGADTSAENSYGCCPARLAARVSDAAAWRAITTHVAARCGCAERIAVPTAASSEPQPMRKSRVARPKPSLAAPPVSGEELKRLQAVAEAVAAELIADEAAEKAQRARKELQRTKRRLKKQRARLQKLEEAAGELHESADDDDGDGGQQSASSPDEDDLFDEPDWIADLLGDFDAGSDPAARRRFVVHSVRMCASLKLQCETVLRCVVCLDGARGTVLQPCGHAQLCRSCAARVTDGETGVDRRCPVCLQGVTGWAPAFL